MGKTGRSLNHPARLAICHHQRLMILILHHALWADWTVLLNSSIFSKWTSPDVIAVSRSNTFSELIPNQHLVYKWTHPLSLSIFFQDITSSWFKAFSLSFSPPFYTESLIDKMMYNTTSYPPPPNPPKKTAFRQDKPLSGACEWERSRRADCCHSYPNCYTNRGNAVRTLSPTSVRALKAAFMIS